MSLTRFIRSRVEARARTSVAIALCILLSALGTGKVVAHEGSDSSFLLGGSFSGGMIAIETRDAPDSIPSQHQFDFAFNLDLEWQLHERVVAFAQGQGGPGDGPFHNPGPGLEITDLGVSIAALKNKMEITLGSFDAPFGLNTYRLTNNADATANPLILNSLMYSAFVSSPTGTLNALGIKASYLSGSFEGHAAIVNGTDESAANSDGKYGAAATAALHLPVSFPLTVAVAAMQSDDLSAHHASGFGSRFTGFVAELLTRPHQALEIGGYVGYLEYGDNEASTKDGVTTLQIEATVYRESWHIAARASAWLPEADVAIGELASSAMPLPGLSTGPTDIQNVWRYQIGGTVALIPTMSIMFEGFLDKFDGGSSEGDSDTIGGVVALQVTL
jgi:hypothetical protein